MSMSQTKLLELLPTGAIQRLTRVPLNDSDGVLKYDEAFLETLVFENPDALPIAEIDSAYCNPVPICRQLRTRVGIIDALFVTPTGRLVVVETKLWRNPEAKRKVIGQILDYASEISQWDYEDLEREAARSWANRAASLYQMVCESGVDEAEFVDSVSRSLRLGRFLLLICGDGIREGLGSIAEFLESYTTLDFSFGLVEIALYSAGDQRYIIHPRVIAKTLTVKRQVISLASAELAINDEEAAGELESELRQYTERELLLLGFWQRLSQQIQFDDSRQPPPNPAVKGYVTLRMPHPGSWITLYFDQRNQEQGLYLGFNRGEIGDYFYERLQEERDSISQELPSAAKWISDGGKHRIQLWRSDPLTLDEQTQDDAFAWFQENANIFVNTLRPRLSRYQKDL